MSLAGLRVLLAEDNPTNQMVATQMLESLGASVAVARDGVEALEAVEREPVDVMLVDIEMPRVNGLEVIRRIRALPDCRAKLPMIALTAYVMREHRAAIDAAGADGVIAKPILSIAEFGADIRRFMARRSGERELPAAGGPGAACPASAIDRNVYGALAEAIGPAAVVELLQKVEADVCAARTRIERALDPLDLAEIRSATHILISVAGAVGAVRVQEGAKRLNVAAHHEDTAAVVGGAQGFLAEIDRMLDFVRAERGA